MPKIVNINCHKIVNSRGEWTIETHVHLDDGSQGSQAIPEGASKGKHEANYVSTRAAIEIVTHSINSLLLNEDPYNQYKIDQLMLEMDGTPNKEHLGGNSILSVSMAVAKAAANSKGIELYQHIRSLYGLDLKSNYNFPTPVFNVLNGGKHADNNLSFQEFMIIPAKNIPYEKAYEIGVDIYHCLKQYLDAHDISSAVGDEGGFAPENFTVKKALSLIKKVASEKYKVGDEVFLGMDVAADSFRDGENYFIKEEDKHLNPEELLNYYKSLLSEFELIYIEDPYYETHYTAWQRFNEVLGSKLMVVSDDLAVTNPKLLQKVIDEKLANAVIVKPNQVGSLSETLEFIKLARASNMAIIVSHRSGDTAEDTFIADLSVAVNADFIKSGAPARGERVAKYNRLLEIYYSLNSTK